MIYCMYGCVWEKDILASKRGSILPKRANYIRTAVLEETSGGRRIPSTLCCFEVACSVRISPESKSYALLILNIFSCPGAQSSSVAIHGSKSSPTDRSHHQHWKWALSTANRWPRVRSLAQAMFHILIFPSTYSPCNRGDLGFIPLSRRWKESPCRYLTNHNE